MSNITFWEGISDTFFWDGKGSVTPLHVVDFTWNWFTGCVIMKGFELLCCWINVLMMFKSNSVYVELWCYFKESEYHGCFTVTAPTENNFFVNYFRIIFSPLGFLISLLMLLLASEVEDVENAETWRFIVLQLFIYLQLVNILRISRLWWIWLWFGIFVSRRPILGH